MKKQLSCIIVLTMILSACSNSLAMRNQSKQSQEETHSFKTSGKLIPSESNYIEVLRDQILDEIITEYMSDVDKVKAITCYLIETSNWEDPMAYDAWIVLHENYAPEATYLERKASSILQFGYGYCDDFAAAAAVLLEGAGIEVKYIPGLAYSSGRLMDHAWNLVKIDGSWYHLDTTYENSVSRNGQIAFRYFLKGNEDMRSTHVWGEDLLNGGYLTELQNEQIQKFYDVKISDESYPQVSSVSYTEKTRENKEQLRNQINQQREEYTAKYGALDPLLYDATAPVFGDMGYNRP